MTFFSSLLYFHQFCVKRGALCIRLRTTCIWHLRCYFARKLVKPSFLRRQPLVTNCAVVDDDAADAFFTAGIAPEIPVYTGSCFPLLNYIRTLVVCVHEVHLLVVVGIDATSVRTKISMRYSTFLNRLVGYLAVHDRSSDDQCPPLLWLVFVSTSNVAAFWLRQVEIRHVKAFLVQPV